MRSYAPWLLVFAVAALYGQFLWNPIQFDDRYFFMLDNVGNMPISVFHYSMFQFRSLPYATLAWTNNLFGLDLINFRIGNLLLHAATVLALFYFLEAIFNAVYGSHSKESLSPRFAAFFAALLFALHPIATYAAGYLVQRSIVMATLFSLLSMLCYVHGSVRKKSLLLWASVPFYYLAVFSKEHAIMLPFVLLALTPLLHDDWRLKLKQRWGIFVALVVIALFVFWTSKNMIGTAYEQAAPEMLQQFDSKFPYLLSVLTQSWLFFKYAVLWVMPNPAWLSIDMREPFAGSIFSVYLIAAVCFLGWGVGAVWLLLKRGRAGLVGFAMLFPWLMFFTEFTAVRIQESFVLYRSYLWVVGAFCFLPIIFNRVNPRMAAVVLSIIALAMFPVSMERLMTLSNSVLLWSDAEKLVKDRTDLPGVDRIYYNRGTEYIKVDALDKAISDLKQAIALNGHYVEAAYWNLGVAYSKKEDWAKAIATFSKCVEIAEKTPHWKYFHGRAIAFEKLGSTQNAQDDYRKACVLGNRGCEKLLSQ